MTPVEPSAFAAQLIARLEKLKREQDTMSSLEERLQQIQEVQIHKHHFSTLEKLHLAYIGNLCLSELGTRALHYKSLPGSFHRYTEKAKEM